MNKMKIRCGFILFLLLIVGLNTSLSAEKKNINLFLNMSNANFETFAFGAGVELNFNKFFSIKPSFDLTTIGGRIFYLDAVFNIKTSKRLKPFFTIGYLDYYLKGNSHDTDAVKSVTYGLGIKFFSKKGKASSSLGVRFAGAEGISIPIIYFNLILLRL